MSQKSGVSLTDRNGTGRGCALRSLIRVQLFLSSPGEDSQNPSNCLTEAGRIL